MLMRVAVIAVVLLGCHGALLAAPGCTGATAERKGSGEPIVDWYDTYIRPYRYLPADQAAQRLTKAQVETFIETLAPFNRRASLDQMELEGLASQIVRSYARAPDFKGIDTAAAEKIYLAGSGQKLDFSLFCVTAASLHAPDDAFSVTLFGVIVDDCQHVGMRGLVFTTALVNGSPNGQCRPDQFFTRMFVLPVTVGTNQVTFVCGKDTGGCAR